jgi:hypothetical protein
MTNEVWELTSEERNNDRTPRDRVVPPSPFASSESEKPCAPVL